MIYDTVVVGAGVGGISSALLRSQHESNVLLLEQHSLLGGCSSYFQRGSYSFDVGATTLSGLKAGQSLGDFCHRLSIDLPVKKIDPGIHFHLSSGKELLRFSDFEKWQVELSKIKMENRELWFHLEKLEKLSWSVLSKLRPFKGISSDLVLKSLDPEVFKLLPFFMINAERDLSRFQQSSDEFIELINGINLISAQAHAHQVPAFVGAMSLTYPKETYYPWGGMKGLMSFFEKELIKRSVTIRKRESVVQLQEEKDSLILMTARGEKIEAKKVIFNLTHWALENILQNKSQEKIKKEIQRRQEGPAAFCLYFAVKLPTPVKNLYHQVHLVNKDVPNYFISFSDPEDLTRAPQGEQTVTISIHVDSKEWRDLAKSDYLDLKMKYQKIIMDDFSQRFHPLEIKFLSSSSPKTFIRYTQRPDGMVGGLPLLYGQGPWDFLLPEISEGRVFRVGDTVFPGQGWVGVVAGALNLEEILLS